MTSLLPRRPAVAATASSAPTCGCGVRWRWSRRWTASSPRSRRCSCAWRWGWSAGSSPTPARTAPRAAALRIGALGLADGPRLRRASCRASSVTAVPLGLTLHLRLGDVAAGPPARRVGAQPWTRRRTRSPTASGTGRSRSAAGLFTLGYVVVPRWSPPRSPRPPPRRPATARVVLWSLLLCVRASAAPPSPSAPAAPRSGPPSLPAVRAGGRRHGCGRCC